MGCIYKVAEIRENRYRDDVVRMNIGHQLDRLTVGYH